MIFETFSHYKPVAISVTAMVWIEAVNVIGAISDLTRLLIQLVIGVLTAIYLYHKIVNIKTQNNYLNGKNQENGGPSKDGRDTND